MHIKTSLDNALYLSSLWSDLSMRGHVIAEATDNNTDRYKDLDDCMAKSSDIIEEMDNWLTGVSKTNSN